MHPCRNTILVPEAIQVSGSVQVLSLAPELRTWEDYVAQVGIRKPLTLDLVADLLKEGVADQYTYAVHPQTGESGNLVVNTGLARLTQWAIGQSIVPMTVVGVGASGTTPGAGDTDMNSPIAPRQNVTNAFVSGTTAYWDTSFTGGANVGIWAEAGLYDSITGGTMGSHALFASTVTKGSNQVIIEWAWAFTG